MKHLIFREMMRQIGESPEVRENFSLVHLTFQTHDKQLDMLIEPHMAEHKSHLQRGLKQACLEHPFEHDINHSISARGSLDSFASFLRHAKWQNCI